MELVRDASVQYFVSNTNSSIWIDFAHNAVFTALQHKKP